MRVGEAVSGEQDAALGVEVPAAGDQVAEHAFDDDDLGPAEVEPLAGIGKMQPIGELREDEVEVADVSVDARAGAAREDLADAAGMCHLRMRWKDVPHLGHARREALKLLEDH